MAPRFDELLKQGGRLDGTAPPRFDDLLKAGGKIDGEGNEPASGPSEVESLAKGGAQGITIGTGDEITGAIQGGADSFLRGLSMLKGETPVDLNPINTVKHLLEQYRYHRDVERGNNARAREAHPNYYMGGEIVGGAALPIPVGAGVKGAMKAGAALGGAYGLGTSESDLSKGEVGGALLDTAAGGAAGATGGAAGHGLIKAGEGALSGLKSLLSKYAAGRALKAVGGTKATVKNIVGKDKVGEFAADLYDHGIVTPLASMDEIAERVGAKLQSEGASIGRHFQDIDRASSQSFNADAAAARLEKELLEPIQKSAAFKSYAPALSEKIQAIREIGSAPFEQANRMKSEFADLVNWNSDSLPQDLKKRLVGILNSEIENQIASSTPGTALSSLKEAKRLYGNLKEADKMASNAKLGREGNRFFSPTDYLAGAGAGPVAALVSGAAPAAAATAAGAAFLNKLFRERGSQFTGALSHRAAQGLERFLQKQPGLASDLARKASSASGFQSSDLIPWIQALPRELQLQLQAEIDAEPVPVSSR